VMLEHSYTKVNVTSNWI